MLTSAIAEKNPYDVALENFDIAADALAFLVADGPAREGILPEESLEDTFDDVVRAGPPRG